MLEVGLIGVLSSVVTIALQPWGGKLVDGVGRRPLIILYRLSLVLVPVLYALAATVYHLYLLNLVIGITAAFGDIAVLAYLLDISKEETRGTLTAFYNLIIGTFYFIGSLVGGYLATYFIGIFGLLLGLQIVYAMSAVGRGIGAFAFMSIKEPFKYPSSLKKEIHELRQRLPLIPERNPSQP
jgi:MFS family permease